MHSHYAFGPQQATRFHHQSSSPAIFTGAQYFGSWEDLWTSTLHKTLLPWDDVARHRSRFQLPATTHNLDVSVPRAELSLLDSDVARHRTHDIPPGSVSRLFEEGGRHLHQPALPTPSFIANVSQVGLVNLT
ncbi:hypothetical protein AB1N83_007285 [Pleurotus pulmonarius]